MKTDTVKTSTAEPAKEPMQVDSITKPTTTTTQSKPIAKPTEGSTKAAPITELVIEPAKPTKEHVVSKARPVGIDSNISIDNGESDDNRDSDELDKIVTIVHDVDSTSLVEDAAVAGEEPADNTDAATPCGALRLTT